VKDDHYFIIGTVCVWYFDCGHKKNIISHHLISSLISHQHYYSIYKVTLATAANQGMFLSRRLISGIFKRSAVSVRLLSVANNQDAGQRYREYRGLQNMDAALTKSIKSLKKKLTKDIEKAKLDQLSELIESRGFEIDIKTCPKTLYLSKTVESGENIVISIWKEVGS
jgi:hypothetical protein